MDTPNVEVIDINNAITASDRAEIDIQIATAKRYPRTISKCLAEIEALACADEDVAGSMFYSKPRADKPIEGPSARFAEIALICWGNARAEAEVVGVDDKYVYSRATCIDLERNVATRMKIRERITTKHGKRYNEDMIVTTSLACNSKAYRNAVLKIIPWGLLKPIYEKARKCAVGDAKTLAGRRAAALHWFGKIGVSEEQVLAHLGKKNVVDINLDDLTTLTGLRTAIKDGETSVDEVFGPTDEPTPPKGKKNRKSAINDLVQKANGATKEEPKKEESKAEEKPPEVSSLDKILCQRIESLDSSFAGMLLKDIVKVGGVADLELILDERDLHTPEEIVAVEAAIGLMKEIEQQD